MPKKLTKEAFEIRARERHNARYTYEKVNYRNVKTKVLIDCCKHGSFLQTPDDHLQGYGCPSCGGTKKLTTKEFVRRARCTHKQKYSYEKTELLNMNTKVTIICKIHGDFEQRPADHVNGVGCPVCGSLKQGGYTREYFVKRPEAKTQPSYLYLINSTNFCKVGITSKRYIKQRFPGIDFDVVVAKQMPLYEAFLMEQTILRKYKKHRYKSKELQALNQTGWTECFPSTLLTTLKQEIDGA